MLRYLAIAIAFRNVKLMLVKKRYNRSNTFRILRGILNKNHRTRRRSAVSIAYVNTIDIELI